MSFMVIAQVVAIESSYVVRLPINFFIRWFFFPLNPFPPSANLKIYWFKNSILHLSMVWLYWCWLQVSRLGFGCGGLSGIYNPPLPHEAGCEIIKEVFSKGITFFDTSDLYGDNYDNEIMVGKVNFSLLVPFFNLKFQIKPEFFQTMYRILHQMIQGFESSVK